MVRANRLGSVASQQLRGDSAPTAPITPRFATNHRPGDSATFWGPQLSHRYGKPAQIGVSHQPDLPAREFQNGTFLVDKYNAADANAERKTRPGCAVDTGNIRRPPDVTNAAPQHGPRSAEQEPVVYPSNRERIEAAMKVEHAVASRAADDPAALVDHERNAADIGVSVCSRGYSPRPALVLGVIQRGATHEQASEVRS